MKIGQLQHRFWNALNQRAAARGSALRLPEPKPRGWVSFQLRGAPVVLVASQRRAAVYIAIKGPDRAVHFKRLLNDKLIIEAEFGSRLEWLELPTRKESQVLKYLDGSLRDVQSWPTIHEQMIKTGERFMTVFATRLEALKA